LRVGLTGGIGAGKSEVARCFESFGAFIIDTDKLAREAVAPGSDALHEIARVWPNVVRDRYLDRSALAEIVFHDPGARERLNAIVHPHVRRLAAERERFAAEGQVCMHMVPLLFETGYDKECDATVGVIAPPQERIARLVRRDRFSVEQIRARMEAQIDPQKARELATYAIENDADYVQLKARAREVYDKLTASA